MTFAIPARIAAALFALFLTASLALAQAPKAGTPYERSDLGFRVKTPADWELGMQKVVRGFAVTPLFRPVIYVVLAILVIVLARRRPLLRNLAIAGLAYELVMFFTAPTADYRYSHFFITAVCVALGALIAGARKAWRSEA